MKILSMKDMWNSRYQSNEFAYGKAPNQFFKDVLNRFNLTGEILLPAEGEGRNAVYAAQKGLSVYAFDISVEGKNKALRLAKEKNVQIRYEVGEITDLALEDQSFDIAALTFVHLPPNLRSNFHCEVAKLIKPGGVIIIEGFSKNNLKNRRENPNIGGPNNPEMLFSVEEIKNDFKGFEIVELQETNVELKEGSFHNGLGSVIRFIGRKVADN
jgi:SAM-dependent methyltransferase